MNYLLIGNCTQSFIAALAVLGSGAVKSAFCTKHGFWAISLEDEQNLPHGQMMMEDVEYIKAIGEMSFTYPQMQDLCPILEGEVLQLKAR